MDPIKTNNESPAIIIDSDFISISFTDGNNFIVRAEQALYLEALRLIKAKEWGALRDALDATKVIASKSSGRIRVEGNTIFYDNNPVHNVVTERILEFIEKDFPFEPLINFLESAYRNPSHISVDQLYGFLEANPSMAITEDGAFLALKKVDDDYRSYHTSPDGTRLFHGIGSEVKMPREEVDPDRNRTCSRGLHFCSREYLPCYYGHSGKVVVLKIFPEDVVAIPSDYNNAKGRACRYFVVNEVTDENIREHAFSSPLYSSNGSAWGEDDYEDAEDLPEIFRPETSFDRKAEILLEHLDELACEADTFVDMVDLVEEFSPALSVSEIVDIIKESGEYILRGEGMNTVVILS